MRELLPKVLLIALMASEAACATKHAPNIHSADCAAAHFPVQLNMAGSLDGFAGQYTDGVRWLTLRQDGYSVLLADSGGRERELRMTAEWRFQDGCGVTYQLSLPLDGVGAWLEIITSNGQSRRLRRVRRDLG